MSGWAGAAQICTQTHPDSPVHSPPPHQLSLQGLLTHLSQRLCNIPCKHEPAEGQESSVLLQCVGLAGLKSILICSGQSLLRGKRRELSPHGRQHANIRMEMWQVLICPWLPSLVLCKRNSFLKCLGTERTHPEKLILLETDLI